MTVIYRLCGIPSTNPSPIFQEDKYKLNLLCLRSFLRAFKDVDMKVVYLLDHCDARYRQHIITSDSKVKEIIETNVGINETMLMSYEIANEANDDIILFQECDYLYRPKTGKQLEEAVKQLGLVSPYDNLNFYLDPSIHSPNVKLRLVENHTWRTVERTTMTFGLQAKILKDNIDIFTKYGYLDNDVWHELRAKGNQMWSAIPALATHMVKDFMSPNISWKEEYEDYL